MSIGINIKKMRVEKGMSQEVLAEKVNVSQATLSNIEVNKSVPDIILLQRFAEVLGIEVNKLLDNDTIIVNNKNQKGGVGYAQIVNQLSEKLIIQYEERLKEKEILIKELKETLKNKNM